MSERDAIVAVTDADRAAAKSILWVATIIDDEDAIAQAFARHRATHAAEVERLREALEAIREAARLRSISGSQIYASIIHRADEIARQALGASR